MNKFIIDALRETDCLVLPTLGAFVAQYEPARISIANNKISPPSKRIVFNEQIQVDATDFLIHWITITEQVDLIEAKKNLYNYISEIKENLKKNRNYTIDNLGKLVLSDSDVVIFEQFDKVNLLKDSYGLPDLYYKPIDRQSNTFSNMPGEKQSKIMNSNEDQIKEYETAHADYETNEAYSTQTASSISKYYVAAIFAFLFTVATSYYVSMDKETYAVGSFSPLEFLGLNKYQGNVDISKNKLLPEGSEEEQAIEKEAYVPSTDFHTFTEDLSTENSTTTTKVDKQPFRISNVIEENTGKYYIIAGSFKNSKKADQLRKDLESQGVTVYILKPNDGKNLYKVSIESFDTYESASNRKSELIANYGEALWVFNF